MEITILNDKLTRDLELKRGVEILKTMVVKSGAESNAPPTAANEESREPNADTNAGLFRVYMNTAANIGPDEEVPRTMTTYPVIIDKASAEFQRLPQNLRFLLEACGQPIPEDDR